MGHRVHSGIRLLSPQGEIKPSCIMKIVLDVAFLVLSKVGMTKGPLYPLKSISTVMVLHKTMNLGRINGIQKTAAAFKKRPGVFCNKAEDIYVPGSPGQDSIRNIFVSPSEDRMLNEGICSLKRDLGITRVSEGRGRDFMILKNKLNTAKLLLMNVICH